MENRGRGINFCAEIWLFAVNTYFKQKSILMVARCQHGLEPMSFIDLVLVWRDMLLYV